MAYHQGRFGRCQPHVVRLWACKVMALYRHAREIAQAIGFDINHQSSGGGSDGNFTGALGITTLDGLGVQGALAHTLEEHVLIDSLVPRAKLMAGLLTTLN